MVAPGLAWCVAAFLASWSRVSGRRPSSGLNVASRAGSTAVVLSKTLGSPKLLRTTTAWFVLFEGGTLSCAGGRGQVRLAWRTALKSSLHDDLGHRYDLT